jgi:hypothetical protein
LFFLVNPGRFKHWASEQISAFRRLPEIEPGDSSLLKPLLSRGPGSFEPLLGLLCLLDEIGRVKFHGLSLASFCRTSLRSDAPSGQLDANA